MKLRFRTIGRCLVLRIRVAEEERELLVYRTTILLAFASLFCLSGISSAQDISIQDIRLPGDDYFASPLPSQEKPVVNGLPSSVLGVSTIATDSKVRYEEEQAEIERANYLVLMGIAGTLVASLAGLGLFVAHQRKLRNSHRVRLVGV